MSPRPSLPGNRPVLIAHCLIAIAVLMAVAFAATAHAGQFKMVACAGDSGAPPYTTATNTVTAQHPGGIFDVNNWCGGAGGDPPGDAAIMRISEHEPNGNAGYGAYEQVIFETPWYVHFKSAGAYTREPNAFNAGWLARFRVLGFDNQMTTLLNQGSGLPNSGLDFAASGIFGPHLWPFGSYGDYHHFYYELLCSIPGGCDRANYNAVDANAFVFILSDDSPSEVTFTHTDSQTSSTSRRWAFATRPPRRQMGSSPAATNRGRAPPRLRRRPGLSMRRAADRVPRRLRRPRGPDRRLPDERGGDHGDAGGERALRACPAARGGGLR